MARRKSANPKLICALSLHTHLCRSRSEGGDADRVKTELINALSHRNLKVKSVGEEMATLEGITISLFRVKPTVGLPYASTGFFISSRAFCRYGGSSESEFWRILVACCYIEQIQPEHKKHTTTPSLPPIPQDAYRSMGVPLLHLQQYGRQRPGVRHLGCAFRLEFRFLPVLIFRNSGYSGNSAEHMSELNHSRARLICSGIPEGRTRDLCHNTISYYHSSAICPYHSTMLPVVPGPAAVRRPRHPQPVDAETER
jgi:hypothetical protein